MGSAQYFPHSPPLVTIIVRHAVLRIQVTAEFRKLVIIAHSMEVHFLDLLAVCSTL
jgi:hypothetical protein